MRILIVLTSHDRLAGTGEKTGLWLEELATPYYLLQDAGASVELASPKGGRPPVDPKSELPDAQTDMTRRLRDDGAAAARLGDTHPLASVAAADFDGVFYPGGHGPMWDLAGDPSSIALIEAFMAAGKPVAAVCHGPAALLDARGPDGGYLLAGRHVTGFSDSEERAVGLAKIVPFLLEVEIKRRGAHYVKAADWAPHAVVDGNLVTGQNPASSAPAAEQMLRLLRAP